MLKQQHNQFCNVKAAMPSVPTIQIHTFVKSTKIPTAAQKYFYEKIIPPAEIKNTDASM